MKTLTRDGFLSVIKDQPLCTKLDDGGFISLTTEQALEWFDSANTGEYPTFVQLGSESFFIGGKPGDEEFLNKLEEEYERNH